ncbi:class I SAM-dependent methyltransferase [Muricomes intestini]|uniref:class I SAM-dependent methyltransferase n=1 Tax=Muricomes intestini TaxID=1796634 RepID=UPI002FDE63F8
MKWNSALYDKSQTFVSEYGKNLISLIPQEPELCILDVGCGTGDLTQKLSEISTYVIGIDGSKEMIQAAKVKYPHLTFDVMDACHLNMEGII